MFVVFFLVVFFFSLTGTYMYIYNIKMIWMKKNYIIDQDFKRDIQI